MTIREKAKENEEAEEEGFFSFFFLLFLRIRKQDKHGINEALMY